MNKDEIDAAGKVVSEVVKPLYDDALKPVAQEVGKALGTVGGVINVALAPLEVIVYGLSLIKEDLKNKLENKLANIPPENIIHPPIQVVGPLVEKYKYIASDPVLSDMFVTLLSKAMNKDEIKKAHPSFVSVISELSPDEARLIQLISRKNVLPKLDVQLNFKKDGDKGGGYIYLYKNFTLLGEEAQLENPEFTPTYLSNLQRLGVLSYEFGISGASYTNKEYYKPLREHPTIVEFLNRPLSEKEEKVEISEGGIDITEFGLLFMEAVVG